jgi:hypothetical protein
MRLLFNAYDADPRKVKAEDMNFQVNTLDLRQRQHSSSLAMSFRILPSS